MPQSPNRIVWLAIVLFAVTIVTILSILPVVRVPSGHSAKRVRTGRNDEQLRLSTWTTIDGTYAVFRFCNRLKLRVSRECVADDQGGTLHLTVLSVEGDSVHADRIDDSGIDL